MVYCRCNVNDKNYTHNSQPFCNNFVKGADKIIIVMVTMPMTQWLSKNLPCVMIGTLGLGILEVETSLLCWG